MIGGFPPQPGTKAERHLLKLFKSLGSEDQHALTRYAEYLVAQADSPAGTKTTGPSPATPVPPQPLKIERPAEESVIKAIKRLNKTYFMLDTAVLLDKTSELMTQHILQGRSAADVIDDLEALFRKTYEDMEEKS